MSAPTVIAVVLARDERKVLGHTLSLLNEHKKAGLISKIVVIDDGSRDSTAMIAKRMGAIVVKNKYLPGKRGGFMTGAYAAKNLRADAMLLFDADLQQLPRATITQMTNAVTQGKAHMALAQQYEETDTGVYVRTSPHFIGQRSFNIKALAPLFNKNKKWMDMFFADALPKNLPPILRNATASEALAWGLEEAFTALIHPTKVTMLPNAAVYTHKALRRGPRENTKYYYDHPSIGTSQLVGGRMVEEIVERRARVAQEIKNLRKNNRSEYKGVRELFGALQKKMKNGAAHTNRPK